jgi:hypothetical protein
LNRGIQAEMTVAALHAPAPRTLAELEAAAVLLYAAEIEGGETPDAAARLRECAMGIIWFAAQRDRGRLRKPAPGEAVIFKAPATPPSGARS